MSEVKVNKISPRTNCGTVQLGDSGDTITIPSGATITNNGTQTGFGRTGTVDWDTTAKTASFTAVSGNGYFVNTTSGAVTITLPASPSAGDIVAVADYANTFSTNNLTVARNSSLINGAAFDYKSSTDGISLTFVYVDGTRGWKNVNDGTTNATGVSDFIIATGGTITTSGDFKIHTFTGPGTFCVSAAGTPAGSTKVDYLVVAGGGGGGRSCGNSANGAGGAGGFRASNDTCMPSPQTSPLANSTGITVTATAFPITVGAGGPGAGSASQPAPGVQGSNSVFSTITSTGGGFGAGVSGPGNGCAGNGGSGGGAIRGEPVGTGNTPPVTPPQGKNGGTGTAGGPSFGGGGGGGAGAVGTNSTPTTGGAGGIGSFMVSAGFAGCNGEPGPVSGARYFAGGGGGGNCAPETPGTTAGGIGGGGDGGYQNSIAGTNGVANTGGGGGAPSYGGSNQGGIGGSGIVIIRYKFQ